MINNNSEQWKSQSGTPDSMGKGEAVFLKVWATENVDDK
jgi:hypothetical protein